MFLFGCTNDCKHKCMEYIILKNKQVVTLSDFYSEGAWFKSWLGKLSWLEFYMIFSVPLGL